MERTKTRLSCLTDKCFPPASSLPPPACFVYNIEVHGEHVYQVGELGVLVHNNYLQEAIARGMKVLRGPSAPEELVGVMDKLGRPISRVQIGDVIHKVKADVTVGLGAADDIVFDLSGGMWNSRNGEPIGKIWEWL
jgi:hypothetical protein